MIFFSSSEYTSRSVRKLIRTSGIDAAVIKKKSRFHLIFFNMNII